MPAPSSTVSILRWDDDQVEAYALADSPIAIALAGGNIQVVVDQRLDAVVAETRRAWQQLLRAGHGFGPELAALVDHGRNQLWRARNTTEGFWIAEASPEAAAHAVRQSWPRTTVAQAIVCTDGTSAAVDLYRIHTGWPALFAALETGTTPADLLKAIAVAEAADPHGQRWPRLKYDDDATAIHIRFA